MNNWKQELRARLERTRIWPRSMPEAVKNAILDAELDELEAQSAPPAPGPYANPAPDEQAAPDVPSRADVRRSIRRMERVKAWFNSFLK